MKPNTGLFGLLPPLTSFTRARSSAKLAGLALIASAALGSQAGAAVTLNLNQSTPISPDGTAPWVVATFQDTTDLATLPLGTVRLTINPSGLGPAANASQFVSLLGFNVAATNPDSALTFTYVVPAQLNTDAFTKAFSATYDQNDLKVQGGGTTFTGFDILINLPPPTDNYDVINYDGTVVIDIFRTGLTANDFNQATANGRFAAAHIQGIGTTDDSTMVFAGGGGGGDLNGVPEPASMAGLMGLLSCGMLLRSRRSATATA